MPIPQPQKRYTYQDYCSWPDEERWELIDGVPYNMSPAPSLDHQQVVGHLIRIIGNALQGKTCVPFVAPTDVMLSDYDVVQPDFFVVCDRKKRDKQKINGAPDLIFEILSPETHRKDRWEKKRLYERYGVREYILVDTDSHFAEQYHLEPSGKYDSGRAIGEDEVLVLKSLDGLELNLSEVFVLDWIENPMSNDTRVFP